MKRKFLPVEQLKKLNTKRLLSYLKVLREEYYRFYGVCGCCGESLNKVYPGMYPECDLYIDYMNTIKRELRTREHIAQIA